MASFQQGELIKVLLVHEASNLSASMLEQLSEGKLETQEPEEQITEEPEEQITDELEEQPTELPEQEKELAEKNKELEEQPAGLDSALVKAVLSQLREKQELKFFTMIAEEAQKSFKKIASIQLPSPAGSKGSMVRAASYRAAAYL